MVAFFCRHVFHYSCLTEGKVPSALNVAVNAFSNERVVRAMSRLYSRPGYSLKESTTPFSSIAHVRSNSALDESGSSIQKDGLSCPLCNSTKTMTLSKVENNGTSAGGLVGSTALPSSSGALAMALSSSNSSVAMTTSSAHRLSSAGIQAPPPPITKNLSKAGGTSSHDTAPALPYRAATPSIPTNVSSGSRK